MNLRTLIKQLKDYDKGHGNVPLIFKENKTGRESDGSVLSIREEPDGAKVLIIRPAFCEEFKPTDLPSAG